MTPQRHRVNPTRTKRGHILANKHSMKTFQLKKYVVHQLYSKNALTGKNQQGRNTILKAPPEGLEPTTSRLTVGRICQLSYKGTNSHQKDCEIVIIFTGNMYYVVPIFPRDNRENHPHMYGKYSLRAQPSEPPHTWVGSNILPDGDPRISLS